MHIMSLFGSPAQAHKWRRDQSGYIGLADVKHHAATELRCPQESSNLSSESGRRLPADSPSPEEASAMTARCSPFRAAMNCWSQRTSLSKAFIFAASGIRPIRLGTAASPADSATSPPWEAYLIQRFSRWRFPSELPQRWVDDFVRGLLKLARQYKVQLAGGDTAQSPGGVLADIIVVGIIPTGKAVLRSGANVDDAIYVSGTLGASVATLEELRSGEKLRPSAHLRHFYPDPRIALGRYLREKKLATAMIDTSDGLSTDLRHICDESGVGAVIEAAALPAMPGGTGPQYALHGGEDYELLFTASPHRRIPRQIAGVPITPIGTVTRGHQIKVQTLDGKFQPLPAGGWQHFA